jgi:hypothetical protein
VDVIVGYYWSGGLPLVLAASLLSGMGTLAAQDTTPPRRATRGCFHGGPADRCAWFTLTESGVQYRLSDVLPGDERLLYGFTLGLMVNRADRSALGGEAFAGVEGDVRGGVAVRWRRWLGRSSSLDLAAGVHLVGDASSGHVHPGSPMLQATLIAGDRIGASARLDVLRLSNSCPDATCVTRTSGTSERLYVGGQVGSGLGLGAALAVGFGIVAFVLSYGN